MLANLPRSIARIAVVRALHLGDFLLAVPAWRLLRQAYPDAEITLIGLPWAQDLVRRYSYLDRLLAFPGFPGMLEVKPDERRLADFLANARAYHYDLAIQMHGSGENSAAFTAALGARFTAGYEPLVTGQPVRLDYSLPYPSHLPEIHRGLRLVESLTRRRGETALELPLLPDDCTALAALPEISALPRGARMIGIHPGARPSARRWMPERFAAVADALATRTGATIVITGGSDEEQIARAMLRHVRTPVVNLVGRTDLGALAALISRMSLFVSNDSGPAHVAVAVGTPSIAIFGPADPVRWAPLDPRSHRFIHKKVACSPCAYWDCPIDHRCLRRITVSDVLSVAVDLLQEVKAA